MPLSTKAVAFQISTQMRFFERPGGFVEIIIPQSVQKEKPACIAVQAGSIFRPPLQPERHEQLYYITHPAFYQCLSAGSLSPFGCNVFALQCPRSIAAQRTAVRLSYGLPSQAVHVLSQLLSVPRQVLAAQRAALHEPPPQAAPSQKGCGSCPALRTILPSTANW